MENGSRKNDRARNDIEKIHSKMKNKYYRAGHTLKTFTYNMSPKKAPLTTKT